MRSKAFSVVSLRPAWAETLLKNKVSKGRMRPQLFSSKSRDIVQTGLRGSTETPS